MCSTKKFVLVYKSSAQVLEDYIDSLRIFKEVIEISDFSKRYRDYMNSDTILVFTQMWLDLENFSPEIYKSPNFIFLNVENLTEQKRMDHVMQFIKKGVKVADYSLANIHVMKTYGAARPRDARHDRDRDLRGPGGILRLAPGTSRARHARHVRGLEGEQARLRRHGTGRHRIAGLQHRGHRCVERANPA